MSDSPVQFDSDKSRLVGNALLDSSIAICIKNQEREVLFQNEACKKICGETHPSCDEGCMKHYMEHEAFPGHAEGVQFCSNATLEKGFFDMVLVNDKQHLITLLYPLKEKHKRESEFFESRGLSKREREVMKLVSRGATNQEMASKLYISKSTLKTHLNNIYRKVPELRELRAKEN